MNLQYLFKELGYQKRRRLAVILSFLVFCFSINGTFFSAAAQNIKEAPLASAGLTLTDAPQQALARNRDLAVARSEEAIARGRLQQTRIYPFNPELVLEGGAGRGVGSLSGAYSPRRY